MTELDMTAASASLGASAGAIQAHYDLSNEFFALWLGSTMTYSAALWHDGDDLATAQLRKLDFHLDAANARDGTNLLEIGCGWGSLLERAVTKYGVGRAVGLTLSDAQSQWERAARSDRVEVRLESWVDHAPGTPYDAIVSVGAFEHFAKAGLSTSEKQRAYRHFFEWCYENSAKGAQLSLQSIVYENYDEQNPNPFVEEVFPESDLPRLSEICAASEGLFEISRVRNDREHYAKTLRAWYRALRAQRDAAVQLVGEATYAKYEKYLGVFIVGFHVGTVNLARISARRIDSPVKSVRRSRPEASLLL
jgi:cyclopropane-fatty-acyl-phospholipid synthase